MPNWRIYLDRFPRIFPEEFAATPTFSFSHYPGHLTVKTLGTPREAFRHTPSFDFVAFCGRRELSFVAVTHGYGQFDDFRYRIVGN